MSLSKEAVEYLKDLGTTADKGRISYDKVGREFLISDSEIREYIPNNQPKTIKVGTLSAIVQYTKAQKDDDRKLYVHVESPNSVRLFTSTDEYGRRAELMHAVNPINAPEFETFKSTEIMNIEMQSQFVPNDDSAIILKVIGNLKEENVSSANDDGVSQKVTIKNGVASVEDVKVPNPVSLKPYRTFTEVNQPESLFIFRMRQGMQCALYQVTNGEWELESIRNIEQYFEDKLSGQIKIGNIKILA